VLQSTKKIQNCLEEKYNFILTPHQSIKSISVSWIHGISYLQQCKGKYKRIQIYQLPTESEINPRKHAVSEKA